MKLRAEKLNCLFSLPCTITVSKPRRKRCKGQLAGVNMRRNVHRILIRNLMGVETSWEIQA